VERPLEGDDAETFRVTAHELVAPGHLDREFARLDPGIREERRVGEGDFDQALCELLLTRDAIEIRCVPEFLGLFRQRGNQLGMGMPEGVDRYSCAKVEISLPILGEKVRTFAPNERNVRPIVGWQQ